MRFVLDTNVVVSALLWRGSPRLLLDSYHRGSIQLFTSIPILTKLTDVLSRPKFNRKIAASGLSILSLIDRYTLMASLVFPVSVQGVAPDPDDDVVIGTALAAHAEFLVTGDRPLLSVRQYQSVRIVSVQEALQALAAS